MIRSVRSGKGLGDSLYLQGVARHFVGLGYSPFEVCSNFPDVFRPLEGRVRVVPFRRNTVDRVAHYISRKGLKNTHQFEDCCQSAGITSRVEFVLDWDVVNVSLADRLLWSGRKIAVVPLPRYPMDRPDGYGLELLPNCDVLQQAVDILRDRGYLVVQVGKGQSLYTLKNIDIDLANTTTVADVIDTFWVADLVLGYCSFAAPLAECLNKHSLFVWSSRGLESQNDFIRLITPRKILGNPRSKTIVDTCNQEELAKVLDEVHSEIRRTTVV